jgi:hypothetical protein
LAAGVDAAGWLARHGATVPTQRDAAADPDAGGVVPTRATDHDVTTIIAGIFGHSPLRERALGSAKRTLLASMTATLRITH